MFLPANQREKQLFWKPQKGENKNIFKSQSELSSKGIFDMDKHTLPQYEIDSQFEQCTVSIKLAQFFAIKWQWI